MSVELATAYVSLIPTTKGIQGQIAEQLGGPAALKGADKAGKKTGGALMGAVGGVLKKSAIGVGVAAGTVLGTALFKGWGRLTQIENAQAKLEGLGHSAGEVKSIMDNALASVKGTAFGLDEAATVSASIVASGIKPGKDLEGVLKTVADTATIAGASMSDMGAIFGSVAARGKLQGDDLMQLQSRGIPVLQFLAKHYGITAQAASAMVSKGKVDFASFEAAMKENLAGAALKSGDTTQGAFKNMMAALSRFGVSLLQGVFPIAKVVFGGITTLLDRMGKVVGPLAEKVGGFIGNIAGQVVNLFGAIKDGDSQGVGEVIDNMLGNTGKFVGPIRTVADALGKATAFAKNFVSQIGNLLGAIKDGDTQGIGEVIDNMLGNTGHLVTPIRLVGDAIGKLIGVAKDLAKWFKSTVLPILKQVATFLLTKVVPAILAMWTSVAKKLKPIFDALIDVFKTRVLPILQSLRDRFERMWPTIQKVIMAVVKIVAWLNNLAATILGAVLPPIIKLVGWIISWLIPAAFDLIEAVVKVIGWFVDFGTAVVSAVKTAFDWITDHWKLLLGILTGPIGAAVGLIAQYWDRVKAAVVAVKDWIVARWNDIVSFFTGIPGRLASVAATMWGAAKNAAVAVKNWITDRWNDVIGFVRGVPGRIASVARTMWNSVTEAFGKAKDWIGGRLNDLVSTFRSLPGKIGSAIADVGHAILYPFKWAYREIAKAWNNSVGRLSFHVPSWVPVIGGKGWSVPKLPVPSLAEGAIVPATPGGRLVRVSEAGSDEAVIPLSRRKLEQLGLAGPRDVTVNVHAAPGMPTGALVRDTVRELRWAIA